MTEPTSSKEVIIISSNRQVQNVEKALREWLASHAGSRREAARKALPPTGAYHRYTSQNLNLTITRPLCVPYQRDHVYSAYYSNEDRTRHYLAYASLLTQTTEDRTRTVFTITTHDPANWTDPPPWYDQPEKLQPHVLAQEMLQKIPEETPFPATTDEPQTLTFPRLASITDQSRAALLITTAGAEDQDLQAIVEQNRKTLPTIILSAREQLELCSEIPENKLRQWTTAKAIVVEQPNPYANISFYDQPEELEQQLSRIKAALKDQLDVFAIQSNLQAMQALASNQQAIRQIIENIESESDHYDLAAAIANNLNRPEAFDVTQLLHRSLTGPTPAQKLKLSASPANQQRITTLQDQLHQEKEKNRELQTQLKAYQELNAGPSPAPEPEAERNQGSSESEQTNRENQVLEAITDPLQLVNLHFLPNATRELADYTMKRPNGPEIINALRSIDQLAEQYYQSENGNIGSWTNHLKIPGWSYKSAESETTMGHYGDSRRFLDQSRNERIEVQRHLTYNGSKGSLQVYFEADPTQPKFLVAYVGPHLPYASQRS